MKPSESVAEFCELLRRLAEVHADDSKWLDTIDQWGQTHSSSFGELANQLQAAVTVLDVESEKPTAERTRDQAVKKPSPNKTRIDSLERTVHNTKPPVENGSIETDAPTRIVATELHRDVANPSDVTRLERTRIASASPTLDIRDSVKATASQKTAQPDHTQETVGGDFFVPGNDSVTEEARLVDQNELQSLTRHRLHSAHAEGGLGLVSIAIDESLQRSVALKEIKASLGRHREACERFRLEAQVTARLEHPGIVPVYHLGTHADGRPFYTMRFIHGETLAEAIQKLHDKRKDLSSPLWNDRLRVLVRRFINACQAIAFAHSRKYLHRDIKPANIMLGNYGETLVVDWGLAKHVSIRRGQTKNSNAAPIHAIESNLTLPELSAESKTVHGRVAGTPSYMSPEQIRGQLDQLDGRSDVFSLGCTLYQLLAGKVPFRGHDIETLADQICSGHFKPPSQLVAGVPRPLEAICLKAMAVDQANRYQTVDEMINDLEAWLDDRPVAAFPEALPTRLGRWFRRHRNVAMSIAFGVLATLVIAIVGLVAVDAQRRETKVALTNERAAKQQTRDALDSVTDGVIGQLLARQSELTSADRDFLKGILVQYDTFAKTEGNTPEAILFRADGHNRVAELQQQLGEFQAAEDACETAINSLGQLPIYEQQSYESQRIQAYACHALARLLARRGDTGQAEANYRQSLECFDHLCQSDPGRQTKWNIEAAGVQNNLGNMVWRLGDREQARQLIGDSIDRLQSVDAPDSQTTIRLIEVKTNYGVLLKSIGEWDLAIQYLKQARLRWQNFIDDAGKGGAEFQTPNQRMAGTSVKTELAAALLKKRKYQEAVDELKSAVDDQQELASQFPAYTAYQRQLARSQLQLGKCLAALKNQAAQSYLEQAMGNLDQLIRRFPDQALFKSDLAMALETAAQTQDWRRDGKAVETVDRALQLRDEVAETDPDNQLYLRAAMATRLTLANELRLAGKEQEALVHYQFIRTHNEPESEEPSLTHELSHKAQAGLADCLSKLGRYTEALVEWKKLVELGTAHPEWHIYELQRILCLLRLNQTSEADNAIEQFLLTVADDDSLELVPTDFYDLACCFSLAYANVESESERERYLRRAMEYLEKAKNVGMFKQRRFVANFERDKDFDTIREQQEFQTFARSIASSPSVNK